MVERVTEYRSSSSYPRLYRPRELPEKIKQFLSQVDSDSTYPLRTLFERAEKSGLSHDETVFVFVVFFTEGHVSDVTIPYLSLKSKFYIVYKPLLPDNLKHLATKVGWGYR